jgi:ABC-type sugar transport system ATPase subunit
MSAISLQNVTRRFGTHTAIQGVSLDVHDREVVTVVGPSGCGKSTLLRVIAGLDQPTSGSVFIDGKPVAGISPQDRNVAMVFQNYALYPHMTCYENLALNLRLKGHSKESIEQKVRETARALEVEGLLQKRPRELSGGQRQRIALGRAIIRNPKVFLLDEPLSNLDALLRERVRHELKELFTAEEATVIYVTHDQIEALTLAHRVVVLDKGQVQQIGSPEEVYRYPRNRFVASFIGTPAMNIFESQLQQGQFALGLQTFTCELQFTGEAEIGVRPEAIRLEPGNSATVLWVEHLGPHVLTGLRIGSHTLTALTSVPPAASSVNIVFSPGDVHVFEKGTGTNIGRTAFRRASGL